MAQRSQIHAGYGDGAVGMTLCDGVSLRGYGDGAVGMTLCDVVSLRGC